MFLLTLKNLGVGWNQPIADLYMSGDHLPFLNGASFLSKPFQNGLIPGLPCKKLSKVKIYNWDFYSTIHHCRWQNFCRSFLHLATRRKRLGLKFCHLQWSVNSTLVKPHIIIWLLASFWSFLPLILDIVDCKHSDHKT